MSELERAKRDALAAWRDTQDASEGAKDRLWARIDASAAAAAPGPGASVVPMDRRRTAVRVAVALAAAAAVLLLLRWGAQTLTADDADGAREQAVYGARTSQGGGIATPREPQPASEAPGRRSGARRNGAAKGAEATDEEPAETAATASVHDDERDTAAVPDEDSPLDNELAAPSKRRRQVRDTSGDAEETPAPEAPAPDPLAAEMKLMRDARSALNGGRPRAALRHLARHTTEFPSAQMAEDREALRVTALCDAGDGDAAKQAATAFARRYGSSPHAASVARIGQRAADGACGEKS